MAATIASQFMERARAKIMRVVGLACPIIIFIWVIWIECVHIKMVTLGIYVLAYCL
jgi:hypothetical protein